tara:strand:+ start:315 stop:653 length:339 start_codon:yes stop_codon:yes gene_type:complete
LSNEVGFIKGPFGFHINYPNGWTASVQWGIGNYCSNYNQKDKGYSPEFLESHTAEIASFPTTEFDNQDWWCEFPDGDIIKGWCNVAEVMEFLNTVSKYGDFILSKDIVKGCN